MITRKPLTLQVSRHFKASAERVFDAFLDPSKAGKFMFSTPSGEMGRVEIDARVGGSYVFVERREGVDWVYFGKYLEIARPRRLVFTLALENFDIAPQRVIIDIISKKEGCELTLTQELDPGLEEWVEKSKEGWSAILDNLSREVV